MTPYLANLPSQNTHGASVRGYVEDGQIVIRSVYDGPGCEVAGHELLRLDYRSHIHRPKEGIHDDILKSIAREIADTIIRARNTGYRHAQENIRRSLGVTP